jgi:hypothetical protein
MHFTINLNSCRYKVNVTLARVSPVLQSRGYHHLSTNLLELIITPSVTIQFMTMSKKEEVRSAAALEAQERGDDTLPAYSASPSQGPTVDSPFNFPSDGPPPAFASAASSASVSAPARFQLPIAIPQITSDKTAPFLDAYARPLLQYGIAPESWRAFLSTMSASWPLECPNKRWLTPSTWGAT